MDILDFIFEPTSPLGFVLWVVFGSYSLYQFVKAIRKGGNDHNNHDGPRQA